MNDLDTGLRAWPALEPMRSRLGEQLRGRVARHPEQLVLATAAALGSRWAQEHLDATVLPVALRAMRRIVGDEAEELLQELRTRFFTGTTLLSYRGDGALTTWVRTIATRAALEHSRARRFEAGPQEEAEQAACDGDLELSFLKRQHRAAFRAAFAAALAELEPRQAVVLQLHLARGVPLSRIGAAYGVNKSTVLRWVDAARHDVQVVVRRRLGAELRLGQRELDSWLASVGQLLSVSLPALPSQEQLA